MLSVELEGDCWEGPFEADFENAIELGDVAKCLVVAAVGSADLVESILRKFK